MESPFRLKNFYFCKTIQGKLLLIPKSGYVCLCLREKTEKDQPTNHQPAVKMILFRYISNLLHLPGLVIPLIFRLRKQKQLVRKTLMAEIAECRKQHHNNLNEYDIKKITSYYGTAVPVLPGESYCTLRGRRMSDSERLSITYLGGLTGLFDDFFDKHHLPEAYIKSMVEYPEKSQAANAAEALFLSFYNKALTLPANAPLIKKYALKVFEAQTLSKRQKSNDICPLEIEEITFLKGGYSLLLYRSVFTEAADTSEQKMLFRLGGLGQLENDIFDIYKDMQDSIKTLATEANSISELRRKYLDMTREVHHWAHQTSYRRKNIRRFLRMINLITSRGLVSLDILEKCEASSNGTFAPALYNRKMLICDMGKPVNILKSIHYYALSEV